MSKIRVGILLNSYTISNWYLELLKKVIDSDFAEISLVIINDSHIKQENKKTLLRKNLFYSIYQKIDKTLFKQSPDSQKLVNSESTLGGVKTLKVRPETKGHFQFFSPKDINQISEEKIDVLFRIGFGILKGEILTVAPLGIWSYHHGDPKKYRGMPSCFWEIYSNDIVSCAVLQILTEDLDGGIILSKGYSRIENISLSRSRHPLYWRSLSFFLDNLKLVHRQGTSEFIKNKKMNATPGFIDTRIYKTPSNFQMILFGFKILKRILMRRVDFHFIKYQWNVIYSEKGKLNLKNYKVLKPKEQNQWADPFAINYQNDTHIFYENLDKNHFGTIYHTSLENIKNKVTPTEVLRMPYHLSFPFMFEYNGQVYMLPETKQAKKIQVFKSINFPNQWEPDHIMMEEVEAGDSHLYEHKGKWWLFSNLSRVKGSHASDELHLFSADSPFSDQWVPHPMNPVVSDARKARNAGAILSRNGKLYRPSQDCATKYGYSVTLNEIIELSETSYSEISAEEILPTWQSSINGFHTLNSLENFWVADVRKVYKFKISE